MEIVENTKATMYGNFLEAVHACEKLGKKERLLALTKIEGVKSIKRQIELKAIALGHAQACKEAIPVCGGQCCKWHFPKNLSAVDFFISIFGLPPDKLSALAYRLAAFENGGRPCPMLKENGCFFSFENRPVVCTSAYPCTMGHVYWEFMQEKKQGLNPFYHALKKILHGADRCC